MFSISLWFHHTFHLLNSYDLDSEHTSDLDGVGRSDGNTRMQSEKLPSKN